MQDPAAPPTSEPMQPAPVQVAAVVDRTSTPKQLKVQRQQLPAALGPKRCLLKSLKGGGATRTNGRPPRSPTPPTAGSPNILKTLG